MSHSRRLLLAVLAGSTISALFIFGALLVARLHATTTTADFDTAGETEVAGAFVLTALGLTMAAVTLIGFARWRHGENLVGRLTVRRGMGVLAACGLLLTCWLVWAIGWPYGAAFPIALIPVAVMARDATQP